MRDSCSYSASGSRWLLSTVGEGGRVLLRFVAVVAAVLCAAVLLFLALAWLLPDETAYRAAVGVERWRAGLEVSSTEVAGQPVPFLEGGRGEPLVLLHGFTGDKDNWTRVAAHLTGEFRVIAPDLPGFGESRWDPARPLSAYAIPAQAEWLRDFLDGLGIRRAWLGGNSMGGNIVAAFAAKYPDRVAGLWLLAPLGVPGAPPSEMDELIAAGRSVPLLPDTPNGMADRLGFVFSDPPWLPSGLKRYLGQQVVDRRDRYLAIRGQIRVIGDRGYPIPVSPIPEFPARRDFGVLIVWGDGDRVLAPAGAALLAQRIPGATVVILSDVGHLPMVEQSARAARELLGFRAAGWAASAAP